MKAMEAREQPVLLPPAADLHLIRWWLEIGPTSPGGMGEAPIGWTELGAWQTLAGIELLPWEASAIRRMSSEFISQRYDARKPTCPAPYTGDTPEVIENRSRVDAQFKAMLGAMGKKDGKR